MGPAEAYLSRGARLSTLPDPHRERGLPTPNLEPDVWRGEITVGDQLVLVSPNVIARLGPEELKDALVTLHPQPAMEHLHRRFAEAGGTGSDAGLVLEASEVAVTRSGRTLVPVRPPEPLAGAPDRSPIPLADTVSGGVAAAQAGARRARSAAGGAFGRLVNRLQDTLPRRSPAPRRVTPLGARREMQQRAAVAILVFIAVAAALGLGASLLGGRPAPVEVIASVEVGQLALDQAREDLDRVFGPGVDLVANDRATAEELLKDTLIQLDRAAIAGISSATIRPLRAQAMAGLDRLFGMVDVTATDVFTFPTDAGVDLGGLVRGPDGAPYVLDPKTASVYRINLAERTALAIFRDGTRAAGSTEAAPAMMTVGGPDLLILDVKNVLWRWRPGGRRRPRYHDQGQGHRGRRMGRRSSGDRDVRAGRRRRALQLLHRRSVRAGDPRLHARRRRERLPRGAFEASDHATPGGRRDVALHRRRHLDRRRRGDPPGRGRDDGGLGGRRTPGQPAPRCPGVHRRDVRRRSGAPVASSGTTRRTNGSSRS